MDQLPGVRVRPRDFTTWPDSLKDKIIDQYNDGSLIREISTRLGLHHAEIGRFLRKVGIDTQSNSHIQPNDPTEDEIREMAAAIKQQNLAMITAYIDPDDSEEY